MAGLLYVLTHEVARRCMIRGIPVPWDSEEDYERSPDTGGTAQGAGVARPPAQRDF